MQQTVLIGFDALDRHRLESLMKAGRVPTFAQISREGLWSELAPQPRGFHSMPWPSFIRGEGVLEHGWYAAKRWDPSTMRLEMRQPEWLDRKAFWDPLNRKNRRIGLIDVPFSPRPGKEFNGLCVQGWQNHDQIQHYSHPTGLWRELRRRFGNPIMRRELCTSHSLSELAAIRVDVLAATKQFEEICAHLLQRERWDLFIAVFGAAHRIGHYLWDASQAIDHDGSPETIEKIENAVDEVYCSCDRALGKLTASLGPGTRIIAFSLHGMRKDAAWSGILPALLARIEGIGAPGLSAGGKLFRLKQMLPSRLVERIVWRLPYKLSETIVPLWSRNMYDWENVRCFALPGGDSNGFVRINLKGREILGTVSKGTEYRELCDRIASGLRSFRDADTGEPIVTEVDRLDQSLDDQGIHSSRVPDLVVHWTSKPAYDSRGVSSPEHGEIILTPGWKARSGRSGDHSPNGWLMASGPGIPYQHEATGMDIADLGSLIVGGSTGGRQSNT